MDEGMKDSEILYRCYQAIEGNLLSIMIALVITYSILLMFYWESKVRWWLRLPVINILLFVILLVGGTIEEVYLTFHPNERTKYIKTSIFQRFF